MKIDAETGAMEILFYSSRGSGLHYTSFEYINGYLVMGGIDNNDNKLTAVVDIYDTDMNFKQTININQIFDYASSDEYDGMSIVKSVNPTSNGFYVTGLLEASDDYTTFYSEYVFPYKITSETDGHGTVNHNDIAYQESKETFTVIPDEGYILKSLTVTKKSDGTLVTFTEEELQEGMTINSIINTFTMPADDVHIIAEFVKEEVLPDTSDGITTYAIMLVIGMTALGTILYRRRLS